MKVTFHGSPETSNDALNASKQQQHLKYPKNLLIGHLNINSFRNKFTDFK